MADLFITPPERNHTRSANADWMEIQALRAAGPAIDHRRHPRSLRLQRRCCGRRRCGCRSVRRIDSGGGTESTHRRHVRRAPVPGAGPRDAYPFTVDMSPPALVQIPDITSTPGRVVYLFCLLASAMRENRVQPAGSTNAARKEIANLFQVCACLAAGGYIVGDVASFGFPRATGTDFLPALRDTFQRFGAGEVRPAVPPGHPTAAKDDGIDVIAWRDHPDRMPAKLYLLGQCASGRGWEEKSVRDRIPQFHGWFSTPPATHCLPSMFIPFTLHHDVSGDPTTAFQTVLANKYPSRRTTIRHHLRSLPDRLFRRRVPGRRGRRTAAGGRSRTVR